MNKIFRKEIAMALPIKGTAVAALAAAAKITENA